MKLTTHAIRSLVAPLILIFAMWGTAFYIFLSDELIDEIDDQLELFSEQIIRQWLTGEVLPESNNASNNTYYIRPVSAEEEAVSKGIEYEFKNIYIPEHREEEPARVMHTLFRREDGTCWQLTVMIPIYERNEVISTILTFTSILLIAMLLVVMAVFAWVFKRHTRPLYHVLHHLDNYTIGHKQLIEEDTTVTEFQHLCTTVNAYIERIEEAYEHERRFIGDASHELQTPLAICQNRIEMMMEDDTLTESQLTELGKMQQTMSELIRLNKTLLFLSKIENSQFVETTEVSINALLHRQTDILAEVYESKGISLNIYDKAPWSIQANEELMSSLVSNLLRNAYLHNHPQGTIDIYIREGALSIANTGTEEAIDPDRLFDRFYKGNHTHHQSSGLGLSIVKAICDASSLRITYTFAQDKHIFTISR